MLIQCGIGAIWPHPSWGMESTSLTLGRGEGIVVQSQVPLARHSSNISQIQHQQHLRWVKQLFHHPQKHTNAEMTGHMHRCNTQGMSPKHACITIPMHICLRCCTCSSTYRLEARLHLLNVNSGWGPYTPCCCNWRHEIIARHCAAARVLHNYCTIIAQSIAQLEFLRKNARFAH